MALTRGRVYIIIMRKVLNMHLFMTEIHRPKVTER